MSTESWERTKQILEEALRLAASQRRAYLDLACGTDPDLRAEVESLIASHEEVGSQFLGAAAPEVLDFASGVSSVGSRAGQCGGPYKIVEEIGRGSMGVDLQDLEPCWTIEASRPCPQYGSSRSLVLLARMPCRATRSKPALRIRTL
jgi:hypothetical protein